MDKMKMHSPDRSQENIAKIRELFPSCVTEVRDEASGRPRLAVDFDQLRQELSDHIVEGAQERYRLDWPGKREALVAANAPIAKTLNPELEESVDFDTTKNLFIEGDNLETLKILQEIYLGKIKMIYIDPPYNTGKDFIYTDNFTESSADYLLGTDQKDTEGNWLVANTDSNGRFHSDWLSMIYSRLKLARNLLSEDGLILVHIDENEYPNLEKLLTEIFGQENNLGTVVWDKRNPKGDATGIAQQHELISFYCKSRTVFKEKVDFRRPKENADAMLSKVAQLISTQGGVTENVKYLYKEWLKKQVFSGGDKAYSFIDEDGNVFRPVSMAWPNKKKAPDNYFIPLIHPVTKKECHVPERGWRNPPETMAQLQKDGLILFGQDESTQPTRKYLLKENMFENVSSLIYYGGSDDALLSDLGVLFDTPKVVNISKKLLQSATKDSDIILDFFAGSGTTAHAVMQLNAEDGGKRKFIMVQFPEICDERSGASKAGYANIAEISKERIRRAGKKILKGECHLDWNRDVGFRVLKVDTSNMKDVFYRPDEMNQAELIDAVDNVKDGRTAEDLLFQVLIDWGVDLTLPIRARTVQDKTVFFVDGNALVACFDRGVSEDLVKELAKCTPLRAVFRDNGFISDAAKINVEQIFRQMSPITEVKAI